MGAEVIVLAMAAWVASLWLILWNVGALGCAEPATVPATAAFGHTPPEASGAPTRSLGCAAPYASRRMPTPRRSRRGDGTDESGE
jgi:hypothetical protein